MVNWLEDLADVWFRRKGYITEHGIRIPETRHELDLLATNEKEFVMIDLQTYVGERGSKKEEARLLINRFKVYNKLLTVPPYLGFSKDKKIRRIFISYFDKEFLAYLTDPRIETIQLEKFIKNVLIEVKKDVDANRFTFPPRDISARLLSALLDYGFIREDKLES